MPVRALQSLLPLLDLKIEGRNPAELADFYSAVIDASLFFFGERSEVLSVGGIVAGQGITGTIPVPDDELWVVLSMGAYETVAGATGTNRMAMTHTDSTGVHTICNTFGHWRTAGTELISCSYSGPPFVLQPGGFIGVMNSIASVGRNIVTTANVVKLKI